MNECVGGGTGVVGINLIFDLLKVRTGEADERRVIGQVFSLTCSPHPSLWSRCTELPSPVCLHLRMGAGPALYLRRPCSSLLVTGITVMPFPSILSTPSTLPRMPPPSGPAQLCGAVRPVRDHQLRLLLRE